MRYDQESERRQAERYPLSALAILEAYLQDSVEKFELPTRDISSLEAFLLISRTLPIGVYVKITMYLWIRALQTARNDGEVKVDVDGTVQRTGGGGGAV